jgi:hypothetical protein
VTAQTCTNHCSDCGRHFHGLGAYDRHLKRTNERKNDHGAPEYDLVHVIGPDLQPWTTTGRCDLTGERQEPVTVWQVVPDARTLAWLASKRRQDGPEGP